MSRPFLLSNGAVNRRKLVKELREHIGESVLVQGLELIETEEYAVLREGKLLSVDRPVYSPNSIGIYIPTDALLPPFLIAMKVKDSDVARIITESREVLFEDGRRLRKWYNKFREDWLPNKGLIGYTTGNNLLVKYGLKACWR